MISLYSSLTDQPTFEYDESGKITGYKTKIGGADTVFPFKKGSVKKIVSSMLTYTSGNTYTFTHDISSEYSEYNKLTVNDIIGGIYSVSAGSTSNLTRKGSASNVIVRGYNNSTGIITATVEIGTGSNNTVVNVKPCFYICV